MLFYLVEAEDEEERKGEQVQKAIPKAEDWKKKKEHLLEIVFPSGRTWPSLWKGATYIFAMIYLF